MNIENNRFSNTKSASAHFLSFYCCSANHSHSDGLVSFIRWTACGNYQHGFRII